MPRKQKINLSEVMKALDTVCPKCGRVITPAQVQRVGFETQKCPRCGEVFDAKRPVK